MFDESRLPVLPLAWGEKGPCPSPGFWRVLLLAMHFPIGWGVWGMWECAYLDPIPHFSISHSGSLPQLDPNSPTNQIGTHLPEITQASFPVHTPKGGPQCGYGCSWTKPRELFVGCGWHFNVQVGGPHGYKAPRVQWEPEWEGAGLGPGSALPALPWSGTELRGIWEL